MDAYIDNRRTYEEKERDWREMMRALHFAFYGPKLLVPALSDSRLQDPSKPPKDTDVSETVGSLMKTSTIITIAATKGPVACICRSGKNTLSSSKIMLGVRA